MNARLQWLLAAGILALALLIYLLGPILMPFLVGVLFAYLSNPMVERLMRLGWSRVTSVSVAFSTLSLTAITLLVVLLPVLWRQFEYLQTRLPRALRWVNREAIPWLEQTLNVRIDRLNMELVTEWLNRLWQTTPASVGGDVIGQLASSGLHLASIVGLLALIPIVTFYFLLDWQSMMDRCQQMLPRAYEQKIIAIAKECDAVLAAFLRGQLVVMIVLGLIYGVGLQLIGIKLAMVIGLVAGLASIIPYVGFGVGIVTASIVAFFQFGLVWEPMLMVWGVFMFGQLIEGWVLQPWLLGDRIGLSPVGVIFAVMAGGQLFGLVGMLLALPVAAVIVVFARHAHDQYLQSEWYQRGRERPASSSTDEPTT